MNKEYHKMKPIPFREYSMLDNPRTPDAVKKNKAIIGLCKDDNCMNVNRNSANRAAIKVNSTDAEAIQVTANRAQICRCSSVLFYMIVNFPKVCNAWVWCRP